jgi:AraC family transcriptional regulator of adaptative response/methylated-DNA-[protein]-cysteine methyltransferase
VSLEAATPGEVKSGGAGWTITAGTAESPFGPCFLAESPRGVCRLSFLENDDAAAELSALSAAWPAAKCRRDDRTAAKLAARIFSGRRDRRGLRAFVQGTPFQVQVWRALLEIPPGRVSTYGRIAAAIGHPRASRAVGSAVGSNALAWLIPCHRVIRETGIFNDYRWGTVRKKAMFVWEHARGSGAGAHARR